MTHPFHPMSFELQRSAAQTKQDVHQLWARFAGTTHVPLQPMLFSEWPLIASQALQDKLTQRVEALCQTLSPHLQASAMQARGWQRASPADVLTIDYAIICDEESGDEGWDIRLVEFQAFTSLLTMGYRMQQTHAQLWPQLAECPPWQGGLSESQWLSTSRSWLAGGECPALLEHQAWQRGTLFDLHATSLLWNMPIIEPQQITVQVDGRLFSHQHGVRQAHDQILNRLILSELADEAEFRQKLQSAEVDWHGHPAWYFLVHKGLAAEMRIPFEPKNVKADQWRELNLPAEQLVAKNIYTCGGKGLRIGTSAHDLDQLERPHEWLIQPRFRPFPVMCNQLGQKVYAEVRLIVQLDAIMAPRIAMQIVRMYYAEQASASFFQGREGEGATILHTPPKT